MPKEDNTRIRAEADLIAEFYTGLNKKGRDFVMLAISQANDPAYMRPPRPASKATSPAFAGAGQVQTAPERLTVANEDLQIARNANWVVKRSCLVNRLEIDHLLPAYLHNAPKFSA